MHQKQLPLQPETTETNGNKIYRQRRPLHTGNPAGEHGEEAVVDWYGRHQRFVCDAGVEGGSVSGGVIGFDKAWRRDQADSR